MSHDFDRRSLKLTPEQWATLEDLAQDMGAIAPTGKTAGESSWRTLIKEISNKQITLARKEAKS